MDNQENRMGHFARLVTVHQPLPECLPEDFGTAYLGRYALFHYSTGDGDARWLTVCDTLDDVVSYWERELDPYQWLLRGIIDLETGFEVPYTVKLTIDPIVASHETDES